MSVANIDLVWKAAPYDDPRMLLTLLALADWSNDDGYCWPSISTLADRTRQSERNAQYLLRKLESDEMVDRLEQRGRNHTNEYQLNIKKLKDLMEIRQQQKGAKPEKPAKGAKGAKGAIIIAPFNPEKKVQKVQASVEKGAIAIAPEPLVDPSEEKEEKTTLPIPLSTEPPTDGGPPNRGRKGRSKSPRGICPTNYEPSPELVVTLQTDYPGVNIPRLVRKMKAWSESKGEARASWNATLRTFAEKDWEDRGCPEARAAPKSPAYRDGDVLPDGTMYSEI